MVKNWADTEIPVSPILFHQLSAIEEPEGGQWLSRSATCAALLFFVPYLHCCLFFYFCAVSGPVLHPCQLSTRFRIFLKPHFLLHQSVFCLLETGESAYRARLHLKLLSRPGGRGALPMMAYTGRLRPYKRVGISHVEVYKRVGKSVVWV